MGAAAGISFKICLLFLAYGGNRCIGVAEESTSFGLIAADFEITSAPKHLLPIRPQSPRSRGKRVEIRDTLIQLGFKAAPG